MDVNALIETAEHLGPTPLPEEIAAYQDEQDPAVRGGEWMVTDLGSADWALRRVAECKIEESEVDAMEAAAIAAIRKRADDLRAKARRGAAYFEFQILRWMERNRDSIVRGKQKSRGFLHGKLGWRATGERLVIEDEAAVQAWIDSMSEGSPFVRVKREPVMAAIQKLFKETGEIPPGFKIDPGRDEPYVKAEAPSEALVKEG